MDVVRSRNGEVMINFEIHIICGRIDQCTTDA